MRPRLRDLGISVGELSPGPVNAITDVPGVWVGHATVIHDQPAVVRTGVTMVVPRENEIWSDLAPAGSFVLNGNGELTGLAWLDDSGMLGSPIAITNTHQVGMVRDALVRYSLDHGVIDGFILPVVAETWDGLLSDAGSFPLSEADALAALATASPGPVAEGNVGGGTGMVCHEFKGGIGSASRLAAMEVGEYTVGVLVQANYGSRDQLIVDGVPVGRLVGTDRVPSPYEQYEAGGSIIGIVATDAPLLPVQCRRLARRAALGLARVGGMAHNGSGDLFLSFSTGNHVPLRAPGLNDLRALPDGSLDPLFRATVEATEEAILNALVAAETMTGFRGRTAHRLPHDLLHEAVAGRR
jgi:D-aminopeptidase